MTILQYFVIFERVEYIVVILHAKPLFYGGPNAVRSHYQHKRFQFAMNRPPPHKEDVDELHAFLYDSKYIVQNTNRAVHSVRVFYRKRVHHMKRHWSENSHCTYSVK